jgi:hypothetical protein
LRKKKVDRELTTAGFFVLLRKHAKDIQKAFAMFMSKVEAERGFWRDKDLYK